jgi:hypothetical protein
MVKKWILDHYPPQVPISCRTLSLLEETVLVTEESREKANVCSFKFAPLTMPTPSSYTGCDVGNESITGPSSVAQTELFTPCFCLPLLGRRLSSS